MRGRRRSAVTAAGGFIVGLFFVVVLVANTEDNAYIGLWLVGVALMLSSLPYAVATALPDGRARRLTLVGALGVSVLVGVGGLVIILLSLAVINLQDDDHPLVLRNHFAAFGAFVATQGRLVAAYVPGVAEFTKPQKSR
jgi:hypothetical protein